MINRRHLIAGGAAALFAAPAILRAQNSWRAFPFSLGVASGDPAADGFVIWTRLAPDPMEEDGGMARAPVPIKWEVASDDRFQTIVKSGEELARPEVGHSVHVEVDGLQPDRPYWYRFEAAGERSIRGRARTLPLAGSSPERLRFAVAGCQNYEDGFYSAYRHLSAEDLAFVFHYGDYIYEYRGDPIRPSGGDPFEPARVHASQMIFTLGDYRKRYAQYKMDADLQRAHQLHAFFPTYDDHEVVNNWAGDTDRDDLPPALFRLRRQAAFQAWYEHMPVRRRSIPDGSRLNMYRSARYGDLAELNFLDTRQYRTNQPCEDGFKPVCPGVRDAQASMIGAEQEAWLARNLERGGARWNVLAQQVMMMAVDRRRTPDENAQKLINMDTWAAYEVPRQRLIGRMRGLNNAIVLTGDEHRNWAGLVHDDRDRPVAAEFVSTSISSGGNGADKPSGNDTILANNPQLKFMNDQRGYLVCEAGREVWTAQMMVMDQVRVRGGAISKRATITVPHGEVTMAVA